MPLRYLGIHFTAVQWESNGYVINWHTLFTEKRDLTPRDGGILRTCKVSDPRSNHHLLRTVAATIGEEMALASAILARVRMSLRYFV